MQWLEYIILFKRPVERDSVGTLILNEKLCDNTLISPCLDTIHPRDSKIHRLGLTQYKECDLTA